MVMGVQIHEGLWLTRDTCLRVHTMNAYVSLRPFLDAVIFELAMYLVLRIWFVAIAPPLGNCRRIIFDICY